MSGLTNEYSVVFSASGQRGLSPEEAGRRLFGPVVSGAQATGVLLRNGGQAAPGRGRPPWLRDA